MRRFLLLVHRVPVDGEFTLNDLAGAGGRVDEVASVVGAAFLISNALRRDTELTLLFAHPPERARRIRMVGSRLKFLNPDERSTAALLKNALVRSWTRPDVEMETTPGILVGPGHPEEDLRTFLATPSTYWATEGGRPLRGLELPESCGFVVSDPWDPTEVERAILTGSGVPQVALGPLSLRASQCVILLQNALDLRERSAPLNPRDAPTEAGSP